MFSLRLLMVMLMWCKAAAPVGGQRRPELAVAAFPDMLHLLALCLHPEWVHEPPSPLGFAASSLENIHLCCFRKVSIPLQRHAASFELTSGSKLIFLPKIRPASIREKRYC